jgi:hypothetical protein
MLPSRALATAAGIALAATMSAGAGAQERAVTTDQTREPVVGLLDVPDLVGNGCGATEAPKGLAVFDTPAVQAPRGALRADVRGRSKDGASCEAVALVVRGPGVSTEALTEESGYEVPALIVYERSGEWFRIALHPGSAWVQHEPRDFLPYPDLLSERLAYVRKGWNGALWDEPGSGPGATVPRAWREHLGQDLTATVLAVRRVGSDTWIQLRLLTESCGETVPGVESVTGWIHAYTASGRPAAWFYSRGC